MIKKLKLWIMRKQHKLFLIILYKTLVKYRKSYRKLAYNTPKRNQWGMVSNDEEVLFNKFSKKLEDRLERF